MDDWAAEALDGLADKTVRSHVDLLRPVTMLIGNVPLRDLTAQDVRRTLSKLAQMRSTRTMARAHNVLVRAIRPAEANDHAGRNAASLVKPPQGETGRPSRTMTAAEAAALLAAAKNHPRLGLAAERSGGAARAPQVAGIILPGRRAAVAGHRPGVHHEWGNAAGRFTCPARFPYPLQEGWHRGVWAPRELRHTFVSVMSVSGVAVEEIARLAGHASSPTAETIYRHELRPVITTGADVMDKIFTAAESEG